MKTIDLDYAEDGITVAEYVLARVDHILDAVQVLNISDTQEGKDIEYHAKQILKHLKID